MTAPRGEPVARPALRRQALHRPTSAAHALVERFARLHLTGTSRRLAPADRIATEDSPVIARALSSARVHWWWLALTAIAALGVFVRVWLLVRANWMLDGDEATMALLGREIQTDGARPIFYPGQAYMGAWQAYLAAVSFEIFGMSRPAAKLVPLLSSVAFIATTTLLARRIYGQYAALLAGLVAAIPSLYFISATLRLSYPLIDVMAIGNVILLLAISMTYRDAISRNDFIRGSLIIGLLTGFAFWFHSAVAMYAAPVALLLFLRWPRASMLYALPAGSLGFVVGALPVFAFTLTSDYTTFHYLLGADSDVSRRDYTAIAEHLVRVLLPRYLGVSAPWQDASSILQAFVAIPTAAAIGFLAVRSWRAPLQWISFRPQRSHPEAVVLLFGLVVVATYIVSRFSVYALTFPDVDATGRYVAPLGTLIPIAIAGTAWRLRRSGDLGRLAASALLLLVVGGAIVNYASTDGGQIFQSPYYRNLPTSNVALVNALDDLGVDAVWMEQWAGRVLMFDTRGRIAAADYVDHDVLGGIERHPSARIRVFHDDNPAFVFVTNELDEPNDSLEDALRSRGIDYVSRELDGYTVVYPEHRVDPASVAGALGSGQ